MVTRAAMLMFPLLLQAVITNQRSRELNYERNLETVGALAYRAALVVGVV